MSTNISNTKKRSFLAKIFIEPDAKPIIKDQSKIKKMYGLWQPIIFTLLYLLYFSSYLGRKSLSVANVDILSFFQLDARIYANLGAIYYATYAVGKFIGGMIADRANVKYALPLSIGVSSLFSMGIAFAGDLCAHNNISQSQMIIMMYISWGLVGFIQSASFPLCGKSLTFWFSNKSRSYVWSWWSTSHEIGTACSVVFAGFLVRDKGWQSAFYIPALIAISISIVSLLLMKDKPVTMGLPDVESYVGTSAAKVVSQEPEDNRTYLQVFKEELLFNKRIWILSATFFCVYILRFGPIDWLVRQFVSAGGGGDSTFVAALKTAIIPAFGVVGTLSIPWVSEKIFKGRRAPATFVFFLIGTLSFICMRLTSEYDGHAIINLPNSIKLPLLIVELALIGISAHATLVMIGGVSSIEAASSKRVAAAATGFTGSMGYLGAIFMMKIGPIAENLGSTAMTNIWIVTGIVAMLLTIPLWNAQASKDYSH